MAHLFISYSRRNLDFVETLRDDLIDSGLDVWLDQVGLTPGTTNWEQALRDAIGGADAVIYAASPDSRRSHYVQDELAIARSSGKPIYPVWVAGEVWIDCVPMGLGHTQNVDLREGNYTSGLQRLIGTLNKTAIIEDVIEPVVPEKQPPVEQSFVPRNPYKGLRAFHAEDHQDFFGRDTLIKELLATIQSDFTNARMLAVLGASGSGKSSLVMAGLLPRLQSGAIENSDSWVYLEPIVPGTHPIENLTITLSRHLRDKSQRAIREDLMDISSRGLHGLTRQISDNCVILYIDQFEELFTLTDEESERRRFIDLLTVAVTESEGVLVLLLSMRADFYDRPAEYRAFGNLIESHHTLVTPMSLAELYDVVEKPAEQDDVRLQFDDGLVTEIVYAVNGEIAALPLMQFTLDQLFLSRQHTQLTHEAYRSIGGVQGALAQHAESTFSQLPSSTHKDMARALFLRLIEPGATEQDTTRRRATYAELTLPDVQLTRILQETADKFVDARLLVTNQQEDVRTIEVSHEALIREWGHLKEWLRNARDDVRFQKSISSDVEDWIRRGKPSDMLYRGSVLEEAQEWADRNTPSRDETMFINQSMQARVEEEERIERQSRNQRRLGLGLVGAVVVAIVGLSLALIAVSASSEASAARATSEVNFSAASKAQYVAESNEAIALAAEATSAFNEMIASTSRADAIEQANNAETQAAIAATFGQEAIEQANLAATSEADALNNAATATIALGQAQIQANNAQTQVAIAATAGQDAIVQANFAATSEAQAILAQQGAEVQAEIAATSASNAIVAQAQAQIEAQRANSLVLAASASQLSDSNSPLALALALEANNIDNVPLVAERVLISVAYEGPRKLFFDKQFGSVMEIAALALSEEVDPESQSSSHIYIDRTLNFRIFTAHETGIIVEWNPETGETLQTFDAHTSTVNSIDVWASETSDTKLMVSGDRSGRVILWDLNTGEIIREFIGHTNVVNTVEFRPDGQRIVTASDDANVYISNIQTGHVVRSITTPNNSVINGAMYSPDGNNILILSDDAMRLIGASSDQFLDFGLDDSNLVVEGEETNRIRSAVFSPSGEFIVTTGSAGSSTPEVWDVARRRLLRRLPEHNGSVNSVVVSEDGQFVLSAADDFSVILSAIASGDEIRSYNAHQNRVNTAIFADRDARVISGSSDGEIFLWDKLPLSRSIRSLKGHAASVDSMVALPFNSNLFLSTSTTGELNLWNGISGTLIQSYGGFDPSTALAVDPTSTQDNLVVAIGWDDIRIEEFFENTTLLDILVNPQAQYEFVDPLLVESHWVNDLTFNNDGSLLASGGGFFVRSSRGEYQVIFQGQDTAFPMLHLWDSTTGELIRQFDTKGFVVDEGFDAPITSVEFSPDGLEVLSGVEDGRLIVWSVDSGSQVREFVGHSDRVTSIQFSPDGTQLLTASNDRTIILWDYATGRLIGRFTDHRGAVNDIAFSPDGTRILSGADDSRTILWDIETGNTIQRFSEQDTAITSVLFIEDGRAAVSGALDGTLVSRGFDTGDELREWVQSNRYIPVLNCDERARYNLECTEDQITG